MNDMVYILTAFGGFLRDLLSVNVVQQMFYMYIIVMVVVLLKRIIRIWS